MQSEKERLDQIERLCREAAANRTIDSDSRRLFLILAEVAAGTTELVE